ncbi:hypothetical protein [Microcoleus sp. D3_18a_C4]
MEADKVRNLPKSDRTSHLSHKLDRTSDISHKLKLNSTVPNPGQQLW